MNEDKNIKTYSLIGAVCSIICSIYFFVRPFSYGATISMLYNIVDDRHFSITAPVEISDQFYGWVLGFGKKAKILKPQKVVDGFTEYLDKIRNMYES